MLPAQLFNIDLINYFWVGLGTLFALPGVLFITWVTVPRLRMLSMVSAAIGTFLGYAITFFVWIAALSSTRLDGAVALTVAFFVSSVTGFCGPLLVNFLGGNPRSRSTQVEY